MITETITADANLSTLAAAEAKNVGTTDLATAWTDRATLTYAWGHV